MAYDADSGGMPSLVPADAASERALRASPLGPTLSFAALGLATMVAVGALGLAQQPSAAAHLGSPHISVRPPDLTLAGAPADARAVAPDIARVTPVELPGAGSLRIPAPVETVEPVVDPSVRSSAGTTADLPTGSAQVLQASGRAARLAAVLAPNGAAAGSSRSADSADRPVAAARKPSTSWQPVPAPRRPGTAPVGGRRTTAPTPSTSSTPQGGVSTPAPARTAVVPEPSPVQGPLLMAARPKGVRVAVAVVPTTIAPSTPAVAKKHQRSAGRQERRSDGQSRDGRRGSGTAAGAGSEHGHRSPAPRHSATQQDRRDHRDKHAKHDRRAEQDRPAKQAHSADQDRPANREHSAGQDHSAQQRHHARHGHGRTGHGRTGHGRTGRG